MISRLLPVGIAAALIAGSGIAAAQAESEGKGAPVAQPAATPAAQVAGQSHEVPVSIGDEHLFTLRSPLGPLTVRQRARAVTERVEALTTEPESTLDTIRAVKKEHTTDVVAGESAVVSVTDGDAAPTGRTRDQLAADFAHSLKSTLRGDFRDRSLAGVVRASLWTLVTVAVALGVFWLLRLGRRRSTAAIRSSTGRWIRALRIQDVEFITADQAREYTARVVSGVYFVLLAVLTVATVHAMLGYFPWTRGFAIRMLAYVLGALGTTAKAIGGYLPNLIYIVLIVWVTRLVIRFAHVLFKAAERGAVHLPAFRAEWAQPTFKIARFCILALAAVVVFPYLPGSESPAFRGIGLFLGVLLSLGSTSAVANVVAGVVLTYMMPFRVGDRVKISETVGDIVASGMLVVRVRTAKNEEITIPNAAVLNNHIVNYSALAKEHRLILHTTVTIGYDVPWKQVHDLLVEAATRTTGVLEKPEPFVLQTDLGDFTVSYELNVHVADPQRMPRIYSDLRSHIQDVFAEADVEITSPHYFAARDGNERAIPPQSREPRVSGAVKSATAAVNALASRIR